MGNFEKDRKNFLGIRANLSMEADHQRASIIQTLMHMHRMLQNLARLRDIQVQTTKDIGMLERMRTRIKRFKDIEDLVRTGDEQMLIAAKLRLQEEIIAKRSTIKEFVAEANEDVAPTIDRLRDLAGVVTPETAHLRDSLLGSLQTEKETRARLVVLRSLQAHNVRFLAMINEALRDRSRESSEV